VAVAIPGSSGIGPSGPSPSIRPGLTANLAPACAAAARCSRLVTVPTPGTASATSAAMRRMDSSPAGVRRVTSSAKSPPATSARASGTA
jgi:hypothetical protein